MTDDCGICGHPKAAHRTNTREGRAGKITSVWCTVTIWADHDTSYPCGCSYNVPL